MKHALTAWVFLLLLAAVPARAQEPAGPAVDSVSELRLRLERLTDASRELAARHDALAGQIDKLGARIERLQSRRGPGGLLPDFELERLLRRSRQLAEEQESTNRALQALLSQRRRLLLKLAGLLRRQFEQLLARARRASKDDGRVIGERLVALRRELGRLQRQIHSLGQPAARLPALPPERKVLASNDPERLRQQADALQDERDRLRRRLAQLDRRIAEARSQIELDRQVNDFLQDHSLFGEEAHALRVARAENAASAGDNRSGDNYSAGSGQEVDGPPTGECSGGMCGTPPDGLGASQPAGDNSSAGNSGRLPPLPQGDSAVPDNLDPAGLLRSLGRRRREVVQRLRELQLLYSRLMKKLSAVQGTASE